KMLQQTIVLVAVFIYLINCQQLTIKAPTNPVECQPLLITWTGGERPYILSLHPGNEPDAPAIVNFGQQNGTSLTWNVNVKAGTSVGLTIRDSTGVTAQSAPFEINAGPDKSCLSNNGSGNY
ncbi:hypothetical protein BJ944DRAFT_164039, partial [Cunninghamella echinulata]